MEPSALAVTMMPGLVGDHLPHVSASDAHADVNTGCSMPIFQMEKDQSPTVR